MTEAFSDKPLRVDGQVIEPKWPWSKTYREAVRKTIRAQSTNHRSAEERRDDYVRWYAETNGLSFNDAYHRLMEEGRLRPEP